MGRHLRLLVELVKVPIGSLAASGIWLLLLVSFQTKGWGLSHFSIDLVLLVSVGGLRQRIFLVFSGVGNDGVALLLVEAPGGLAMSEHILTVLFVSCFYRYVIESWLVAARNGSLSLLGSFSLFLVVVAILLGNLTWGIDVVIELRLGGSSWTWTRRGLVLSGLLTGCLLHLPLIVGVSDRSQLTLWASLGNILLIIRRLLLFNLLNNFPIATVLGLRQRSLRFHRGILIVLISLWGWAESFKHWGLSIWGLNFFILLIVRRSLIGNGRRLLRRDRARISSLLLYQLSLSLSKLMLSLLKLFKHFNLLLHGVRLGKL